MSDFNRGFPRSVRVGAADMSVDAGLRAFMLGVYNKLALGLVLSAALAFVTSQIPAVRDLLFQVSPDGVVGLTLLGMIVGIAPLPVLLVGRLAFRESPRSSGILYWTIVALMGASLGFWALVYHVGAMAEAFLITAVAFGGLSLVGYTTRKDLSAFGSFLIVGLFGLVAASLVNIFVRSAGLNFIVVIAGVFIFAGLIAFKTQQLKMLYYQLGGDQSSMAVATNAGALSLYLSFLNLFLMILRLMGMGGRR